MRVYTAPEIVDTYKDNIGVFLAGGITNCPNWQEKVIEELSKYEDTDKLIVYNPRRKNFESITDEEIKQQIKWEYDLLNTSDIFSMFFCNSESIQPICLYELGRYILKMQIKYDDHDIYACKDNTAWTDRILISIEDGYIRKQDVLIQTELATCGKVKPVTDTNWTHDDYIKNHAEMIINTYRKILENKEKVDVKVSESIIGTSKDKNGDKIEDYSKELDESSNTEKIIKTTWAGANMNFIKVH